MLDEESGSDKNDDIAEKHDFVAINTNARSLGPKMNSLIDCGTVRLC